MKDVTLHVTVVSANTGKVFANDYEFPDRDMALIVSSELFRSFEPEIVRVALKNKSNGDFEMVFNVDASNDDTVECMSEYIARRIDNGIVTMVLDALKN